MWILLILNLIDYVYKLVTIVVLVIRKTLKKQSCLIRVTVLGNFVNELEAMKVNNGL